MAQLIKVFEKYTRNNELQVIELSATANSKTEASELGYDDFIANLFINHKFIAEISPVLAKSEAFAAMVDEVNWEELYCETVAEDNLINA